MNWSVTVLEYGYVDRFPASNLFAAQPNEGYRRMPYCFGLLRSADRCILVDTGFHDPAVHQRLTGKYGRTQWARPVDVLARVGVRPEQVDTILLTHNHFDHAGCVGDFPGAHVWIQRREIDSYVAAAARPARFEFLTRSCQADLPALLDAGRATLVDGRATVAPGVSLRPAHDTHTAGSQVVAVGPWVFAGDNVYSYENLEGLHGDGILAPIAMTTGSASRWLDFADELLTSVDGDTSRVLPFHEAALWDRFPTTVGPDGLHIAEISTLDSSPR
ncbi:N-acyl homoserine lactonase family protein [Paractinoplanes brasiliensis]|uniref:Glyoxylase-like metal-dependent hydrolase (Beta-lactamase superfamily II) n=1 Tax=Paractinoplanes brasiliensis TaxID=52695 RepID=A0A4R6J832_9ACTN|nr:N-acyl homoserine lactonase family protein [Actinoplanes brasiliensis]TDO31699.1 glyoxylase-like metal-dependent hydrolase (beta-lactamase superfamily II) [Actinoplanes brasiliensis]GID30707.1 hydrolase glyoxylase [Actinoplanes brasiliensis]